VPAARPAGDDPPFTERVIDVAGPGKIARSKKYGSAQKLGMAIRLRQQTPADTCLRRPWS